MSRTWLIPALLCLAPAVLPVFADSLEGSPPPATSPATCLALGAGGANGLAHVTVLDELDRLGIRPARIAGSSIGAMVGALYASGMSAADIRKLVIDYFVTEENTTFGDLITEDALRWADFIEIELGEGGLLSSDGALTMFFEALGTRRFESLELPLTVVAADLWSRGQVLLDQGDLYAAVRASVALPGVFEPVNLDGRVLIDGGTVNPVPFDVFGDECDIVIAVDVSGQRTQPENGDIGYFDAVFNSAKVMQKAILEAKRQHRAPDIFLSAPIRDVRALEFYRAEEIFTQAEPLRAELRLALSRLSARDE